MSDILRTTLLRDFIDHNIVNRPGMRLGAVATVDPTHTVGLSPCDTVVLSIGESTTVLVVDRLHPAGAVTFCPFRNLMSDVTIDVTPRESEFVHLSLNLPPSSPPRNREERRQNEAKARNQNRHHLSRQSKKTAPQQFQRVRPV